MATTGFTRPTLAALMARARSDLVASLAGAEAKARVAIRGTLEWALPVVSAGAAHLMYGYLDWIARQILPDTADGGSLDRHAAIWGLTRRAASDATGGVTFDGANGTVVPAGWRVLRVGDGAVFTVDAEATVAGGTVTVGVTAEEPGAAGNTSAGAAMRLESPIAGLASDGEVDGGGLAGGSDEESDDDLRARLLARIASPPQGGAAADYEAWALSVSGVGRVWVVPAGLGAGTVVVRFITDDVDDPIPSSPTVEAVQEYIDERAPVTAAVYVLAPEALVVGLEVSVTPDTADVRAAVEAELRSLFFREGSPGTTIPNSQIRAAISAAEGEVSHTLTSVLGDGTGLSDVVAGANQFPVLGTVTWS